MHQELLSICIPTYNRARYLGPLLASIADQIQRNNITSSDIRVYVSDNASSDATPDIGKDYASRFPDTFSYSRNTTNIGGNANIMHVRTLGHGRYVWVLGDDELICDNAFPNLITTLRDDDLGLLLAYPTQYESGIPLPHRSSNYREFVQACSRLNPHALAEHTLISCNIYRNDCFDLSFAKECITSGGRMFCYPHMFGLLRHLNALGLPVAIPDYPIISLQPMRTSQLNNEWCDMDALWVQYFTWIMNEMDIKDFDPTTPSRTARKIMIQEILRNPVRFLWSYRWELLSPSAYRFFFKRLFLTSIRNRCDSK